MWGYAYRCPACYSPVGPDFLFCHQCGTPLQYPSAPVGGHMVYAPAYPGVPARPARVVWGARTRRGLAMTAAALIVLWIPGLAVVGALLLSIGSTLMFWDRHPFDSPHRISMKLAYLLFWVAAIVYAVVFVIFVRTAYAAWLNGGRMAALTPDVVTFVWASTLPSELLVAALVLQIRFLLPPSQRYQVWATGFFVGILVLLATLIAHFEVAAGLGGELVRMSSVLGVLNRISVARLVEGPGFVWLAYLYYRARENVVPKISPADAPASVAAGPPAN